MPPALQIAIALRKLYMGRGPGHPDWNHLDQRALDYAMMPQIGDAEQGYKDHKGSQQ